MSAESCPHFQICSAPLCLLDSASLANCAWFPDEEVCRRGDYASTPMVRAQKRIARSTGEDFARGCFTAAMLEGITSIGKGTRGLDPDDPVTPERVRKWLSGFRGGRKAPTLTDEQKARRQAGLLRAHAAQKLARENYPTATEGQGDAIPDTPGVETVSGHAPVGAEA